MTPRSSRRLLAPSLLAAAVALTGCAAAGASPGEDRLRGEVAAGPRERPQFTLTRTDGSSYDFAQRTAGRLTVLFFGYTSCPDICPTTLADLATGLRSLPPPVREGIEVVVVSTDPVRDSPPVLADYLRRFDPSFVGLTGTPEQVAAAEAAAGVPLSGPVDAGGSRLQVAPELLPEGHLVEHASALTAYRPDGTEAVTWRPGTLPEDYAADLAALAEEDR